MTAQTAARGAGQSLSSSRGRKGKCSALTAVEFAGGETIRRRGEERRYALIPVSTVVRSLKLAGAQVGSSAARSAIRSIGSGKLRAKRAKRYYRNLQF